MFSKSLISIFLHINLDVGIKGVPICSKHATENASGSCSVLESTSTVEPSISQKYTGGSESYFLIDDIVTAGVSSPTPNSFVEHIFESQ